MKEVKSPFEGLEAGPEMDALVAEKVMGRPRGKPVDSMGWEFWDEEPAIRKVLQYDGGREPLPPYSTNIAAAWEVVEKVGQAWRICHYPDEWAVEIESGVLYSASGLFGATEYSPIGAGKTAPLAICRAALAAISSSAESGPSGP